MDGSRGVLILFHPCSEQEPTAEVDPSLLDALPQPAPDLDSLEEAKDNDTQCRDTKREDNDLPMGTPKKRELGKELQGTAKITAKSAI
ncbi:hypothetical protein TWF481_006352 [Arthrobotrys musiformis]|uniref:Uncharacterized protein n=1 Tax=Arthrobotrys musiformis TaxID=47236 RepID=A0AAV9WIF3_9PEZI